MFGKLVKYDLKNMLGPVGLVMLVTVGYMLAMLYILPAMSKGFIFGLLLFGSYLLVFSGMMATLVIPVWRYAKTMNGRESYFTFTLPVSNTRILNAKIVSGSIIMLIGVVFSLINLGILILIQLKTFGEPRFRDMPISAYLEVLARLTGYIGWMGYLALILFIIWSLISGLLYWYFVVSVGATAPFNRIGNIGGPVVLAVIIYMAFQVLTAIALFTIPGWLDIEALFLHNEIYIYNLTFLDFGNNPAINSSGLPLGLMVTSLLIAGLQWWVTNYSLKKRLSVRS